MNGNQVRGANLIAKIEGVNLFTTQSNDFNMVAPFLAEDKFANLALVFEYVSGTFHSSGIFMWRKGTTDIMPLTDRPVITADTWYEYIMFSQVAIPIVGNWNINVTSMSGGTDPICNIYMFGTKL